MYCVKNGFELDQTLLGYPTPNIYKMILQDFLFFTFDSKIKHYHTNLSIQKCFFTSQMGIELLV